MNACHPKDEMLWMTANIKFIFLKTNKVHKNSVFPKSYHTHSQFLEYGCRYASREIMPRGEDGAWYCCEREHGEVGGSK